MNGSCAGSYVQKNGNCSFRLVSDCMYDTENRHSEIRLSTANKIICEWKHNKNFIMNLSIVNAAEDYKNLHYIMLPRDGEHGGSIGLTCNSRLFFNYLFRVHNENSTNAIDYSTETLYVICCFQAIMMHKF